jgi:hypothetical protein
MTVAQEPPTIGSRRMTSGETVGIAVVWRASSMQRLREGVGGKHAPSKHGE